MPNTSVIQSLTENPAIMPKIVAGQKVFVKKENETFLYYYDFSDTERRILYLPTKTSELNNDSGFITASDVQGISGLQRLLNGNGNPAQSFGNIGDWYLNTEN
jgi:hypothetical protein